MILTGRSLGDVVYGLSCLDDFRTAHPKARIVAIANHHYQELVDGYASLDEVHYLDSDSRQWRAIESVLMSKKYVHLAYRYRIICTVPMVADPYGKSTGLPAMQLIRQKLFYLKREGTITYPQYPAGEITAIADFEQNKHRIVVLNPYSTSLACTEFGVFEQIADYLKAQGLLVYTNVIGSQQVVSGTRRLECSLGELYRIAAAIPLVVSIRSGILDYIIQTSTNLYVIYYFQYRHLKPHMETMYAFARMFDLKEWKTKNKRQHIYHNTQETLADFKAYWDEIQRIRGTEHGNNQAAMQKIT